MKHFAENVPERRKKRTWRNPRRMMMMILHLKGQQRESTRRGNQATCNHFERFQMLNRRICEFD